jgi:hypothetical protein
MDADSFARHLQIVIAGLDPAIQPPLESARYFRRFLDRRVKPGDDVLGKLSLRRRPDGTRKSTEKRRCLPADLIRRYGLNFPAIDLAGTPIRLDTPDFLKFRRRHLLKAEQ